MKTLIIIAALLTPAIARAQCGPDGMDSVCGLVRKSGGVAPLFLLAVPAASDPASLTASTGQTVTCSGGVNGTYQPTAATVATVTSGHCAVDYRGLQVEGASTNIALQSGNLANVVWSPFGSTSAAPTVTANAAVAPNGTMTAAQVSIPAVPSWSVSVVYQGPFAVANSTAEADSIWLQYVSGATTIWLGYAQGAGNVAHTACALSTSWTRCPLPFTTSAVSAYFIIGVDSRLSSGESTTGTVFNAWGGQMEQLPFASSYIATTSMSVTRTADQCDASSITLASTFSASVTVNLEGLPASGTATATSTTDGTHAWTMALDTSGHVKCSYTGTTDTSSLTVSAATPTKIACTYDGVKLKSWVGGVADTGTAASLAPATSMTHNYLGWDGTANYLNGFLGNSVCIGAYGACAP